MSATRKTSTSGLPYFDDSAVSVTSSWTLVTVIPVANRKGYMLVELINSGANPLTSLRISRAAVEGAITALATAGSDYIDIAQDADINVSSIVIDQAFPNPAYTLAAGACAQISILCDGAAEIGIFAKSTSGTTLQNRRAVLPPIEGSIAPLSR